MKKLMALLLSVALCLGVAAGCAKTDGKSGQTGEEKGTIKLRYVNWAEGVAMTHLVATVLEDKMGYDVEVTMADVAPIFTSIASGNTDAFLDCWMPVTHKDYMEEYGDDLVDLTVINSNARIGLVVPSYVEIDNIEDLNANKGDFSGEIVGIDSGAGIMSATEKAIDEYGLEYNLITSSGPAMTAALKNAIDKNEPIVVTGWAPHWKFARWDLKFLDDPKGTFGATEEIHCITRKGLGDDYPEVNELLSKFKMNDDELGSLMGALEDNPDDEMEAART